MIKKDLEDLERFARFLGEADRKRVSCGQKSYKSEQIEQIDIDGKGFVGFGKICIIYSPIGSSTRLGEADRKRVCLAAYHI